MEVVIVIEILATEVTHLYLREYVKLSFPQFLSGNPVLTGCGYPITTFVYDKFARLRNFSR